MPTRRELLASTGGLAAGSLLSEGSPVLQAAPQAASELGRVKIRDVKTASVQLSHYAVHMVKIETDAGIYGIGEAYRGAGVVSHITRSSGR